VRPDLVLIGLDLASWCGGCGRREEWVGVIGRQFPLPSHRVSVASMVQVASPSVDLHLGVSSGRQHMYLAAFRAELRR
jgi:hypothetical protein